MGSISNPGISNLAQILSISGASVAAAAISSPTGQTSLENAPAGDLVALSAEALQLQVTSSLFGSPATASSADSLLSSLYAPTSNLNSLVSSLTQSTAGASTVIGSTQTGSNSSSTSSTSNNSSPAEQMAAYVAAIQEQQTQALFGSGSGTNATPNTINLLA